MTSNGSKWFAMRHGKRLAKLNRPADQRKAMMRTLTTEVLNHGKITTTKVSTEQASAALVQQRSANARNCYRRLKQTLRTLALAIALVAAPSTLFLQ